jgi:hypothetical protein
MSDFLTTDNSDGDISLGVGLLLGKAEMHLFHLTRLCDVGSLLEDLIDHWQSDAPECLQSQVIFTLFLEDMSHRVEGLYAIIAACNKELGASSAEIED